MRSGSLTQVFFCHVILVGSLASLVQACGSSGSSAKSPATAPTVVQPGDINTAEVNPNEQVEGPIGVDPVDPNFDPNANPINGVNNNGSNPNSGLNPQRPVNRIAFANIAPILRKSCAGSSCHSNGSRYGVLVDNPNTVNANRAVIANSIQSGRMPLRGRLSAAERNLLLTYLKQ